MMSHPSKADILERLPKLSAILQVYAVIAVMLSGWTITAFLWKLSAWLLILSIGEIFVIFSYAMMANLLESLVVLGLLLLICVCLPPRIFRDDFVVRGTILSIGLIGSLMAFIGFQMGFGLDSEFLLFLGPSIVLSLTVFVLALSSKSRSARSIRSAVLWVSDRLTVFLFILLPLFIISSAYILIRNVS